MAELEMNTTPQTQIPETKTVTAELPKPLNDDMVRAMVVEAEKTGQDVAAATVATAQTPPAGVTDPTAAIPTIPAPAKFLKPDGTVDVDKLKTSTQQLDVAIQQKQEVVEKTVDDYIREYKEKEQIFRNIPSNPEVIRQQAADQGVVPPPAPAQVPAPQVAPNLAEVRQKIAQDLQVDPVGTIIDLAKAISEKQMEPFIQEQRARKEQERDNNIRRNLSEIAAQDRRILDPGVFQAVNQEIASDPGYKQLRNPHLAAWAVVKERLRLGTSVQQPAQPGRPPSPILGGGTPPPAPSASLPLTAGTLMGAINQAKTPQDQAALEQHVRAALSNWE